MRPYIYGGRNGIYIVDLHKTLVKIEEAYEAIRAQVAQGGSVLFVGTKKQSQESVAAAAQRCGQPFVNQRWLGGMLTNMQTIRQRVATLQEHEDLIASDDFEKLPKNERLALQKQREKLDRYLAGIRDMVHLPSVVFIVDLKKEHIAVKEAHKLEIPVVAIVDTNCDPDEATYPIPGNDDAIRAIRLVCNLVADACLEGQQIREKAVTEAESERRAEAEGADEEGDEDGADKPGADEDAEYSPEDLEAEFGAAEESLEAEGAVEDE